MENVLTFFANGFTSLYFYVLNYAIYIAIGILLMICGIVEYKEKDYLFVDDERKLV